jgi:putative tryptophan/tyrosine transport system substrate-binding protein
VPLLFGPILKTIVGPQIACPFLERAIRLIRKVCCMVTLITRRAVVQTGLSGLAFGSTRLFAGMRAGSTIPRIGFMIGQVPAFIAAFEDELRKLGYRQGETIIVEKRISRPNSNDLDEHAAELAAMDLRLIVAAALPQAIAVRKYNPSMPMVVGTAPGLVTNGFAKSFEHPGGNVTGMDELPPGLTATRLSLLKLAVPSVSRVALLSTTPGVGGHEIQLGDAERGAINLGIQVRPYRASVLAELQSALVAMRDDGVDGLVSFQGALVLANARLISDFAAQSGIPAIYQSRLLVEAGGLMAYSPDQEEQFRIAARNVDKILRGAKPGNIPIRHPSRYYLTFNPAAAGALKLEPPRQFMKKVDQILSCEAGQAAA